MTTAPLPKQEFEWTPEDMAELEELKTQNALLPEDSPRALLSVRLSVLTEATTSPVRQELDLWRDANGNRLRVVGVARDLDISATTTAPWKREELGEWLNNRSPEFDVITFWKLDRFVRRILDLQVMIDWCKKRGKNLRSLNDPIDLKTSAGKVMVTLIAGIAEIEAANTGIRIASLWSYTKASTEWKIGRPPYGYKTHKGENGKVSLVLDPQAAKVLRWMYKMAIRGVSANKIASLLNRAHIPGSNKNKKTKKPGTWTSTTVLLQLRNPALMGFRVETAARATGRYKARVLLDGKGQRIRVAEGIFSQDEFDRLQEALDKRSNSNLGGWTKSSKFLGVAVHKACGGNLTTFTSPDRKGGKYVYLRCRKCKTKGLDPSMIYNAIAAAALNKLGDHPVERREYARGAETKKRLREVEESIEYYMKGLEPGGRFKANRFTAEKAEETLDALLAEYARIDPETTKDRWVRESDGKTYRQHWEQGGPEKLAEDLRRASIRFEVDIVNDQPVGVLILPTDYEERLLIRRDEFKLNT